MAERATTTPSKEQDEEEEFSSEDLRRLKCLLCQAEIRACRFSEMAEHFKVPSKGIRWNSPRGGI